MAQVQLNTPLSIYSKHVFLKLRHAFRLDNAEKRERKLSVTVLGKYTLLTIEPCVYTDVSTKIYTHEYGRYENKSRSPFAKGNVHTFHSFETSLVKGGRCSRLYFTY